MAVARLTRLHAKIAQRREHAAHQVSHDGATNLIWLTIETLNVAGMLKNRSLARAVADAAMAQLGRQLQYKSLWYGCALYLAGRWYPSSKLCSGCGQVKDTLGLAERTYRCDGPGGCGLVLDRDVNAALNLARWPELPAEVRRVFETTVSRSPELASAVAVALTGIARPGHPAPPAAPPPAALPTSFPPQLAAA
jgi:transposase